MGQRRSSSFIRLSEPRTCTHDVESFGEAVPSARAEKSAEKSVSIATPPPPHADTAASPPSDRSVSSGATSQRSRSMVRKVGAVSTSTRNLFEASVRQSVNPKVVRKSVLAIDYFGEKDALPKSVIGGIASLITFLLFSAYVIHQVYAFTSEPDAIGATARWTIVDGPVMPGPLYPMRVECLADGGCEVSLQYLGQSTFSANCVAASKQVPSPGAILLGGATVRLQKAEVVNALVCFSDDPRDGLISWHNGSSPFGIAVESVAPVNGVVSKVHVPIHAGRVMFKLVNTTDYTFPKGAVGHSRAEWYPSLIGTDTRDGKADYKTISSLDAQWSQVEIHPASWLNFFGELGGAWTVCLALGAIFYYFAMNTKREVRGAQVFSRVCGV